MSSSKELVGELIRKKAIEIGFTHCGFSEAGFLEEEAPRLETWLRKGMHGEMKYMENYFDMRLDPGKLVPGAQSVISLLYNYFPAEKQENTDARISAYAYGEDYHNVIREKLQQLLAYMQEIAGEINGRVFVDSAPILDKAWAKKSGLGWIGKNTNLITKQQGSFFFIAEIISDLPLEADSAIQDYCGTCTACIDACPTDAIVEPYVVDGSKCISYFTIELRKEIPSEYASKLGDWIFGCDICQDVCPWNRFSKPHSEPRFQPNKKLLQQTRKDWIEMTEDVFKTLTRFSPVKRTKLEGMQRNAYAAIDSFSRRGAENAEE